MRRKTGNSVVNRTITVAMSGMMIVSAPTMQVYAAESGLEKGTNLEETNEIDTYSSPENNVNSPDSSSTPDTSSSDGSQSADSKYDVSSVELKADSEKVATAIKDEADKLSDKDYVDDLQEKFENIDMTQEAETIIDETASIVEETVTDITNGFIENVDSSSNTISETASDVKESDAYTSLEQTKDTLENSTNILLNNDKNIVANVEGNTVVDTITAEGDIQVNVTAEDGSTTTQSLNTYVTEQKEIVTYASNEAQNIVDSLSDTPTADEVNNAKEDISDLINKAQSACDDAQTAVDSAEAVLNKEIADYNSYAEMCGLPQLDGSSSDEAQNILQQQIDTLTDKIAESDAKVIDALTKIQTAKELLENSKQVAEQAQNAITSLKETESNLEENVDGWLENTKEVFDTESDSFDYYTSVGIVLTHSKEALEQNIEIINNKEETGEISEYEANLRTSLLSAVEQCQKSIDSLSKDKNDDYFKAFNSFYSAVHAVYNEYNRDLEDNQSLSSYHLRFIDAITTSDELAKNIISDISAKQKRVDEAQAAYASALEEYKQLRIEYANTSNALQYFKPLKEKLDTAAKNLADAKTDLNIAKLALNDIKDITIKDPENDSPVDPINPANPENPIIDSSIPISSADSNNSANSSVESNSTALPIEESNYIIESASALPSTVPVEAPTSTITDENVPTADTIPRASSEESTDGNVVISDEDTALVDSIPQTGDRTHSALPVALAGAAALAGALYLGLRKRI